MGYNNERATLNQFSNMKKYCEKNVIPFLKQISISGKKLLKENETKPLKFIYTPITPENYNFIGIDAGIATLFPSEITETKLLKVSSANDDGEIESHFIHIYTGLLKWPEGAGRVAEDIYKETVDTFLKYPLVVEAIKILNLSLKDVELSLLNLLRKNSGKGIEDNWREILEMFLMVKMMEKKESLIIKDGTLYPSYRTITKVIGTAVWNYISEKKKAIGVVKSSRFVNKDNSWAKLIVNYGENLPSHTFFRIDKSIESGIDHKSFEIPYKRVFLTLFKGKSLYEVQVPRTMALKDEDLKPFLNKIISKVTFKYGGSIITNSKAHEEASLAEKEAKALTDRLREELKK